MNNAHLRQRALVVLAGLSALAPLAALAQSGCALLIDLGDPPGGLSSAATDGDHTSTGGNDDIFLPKDPLCIAKAQGKPGALMVADEVVYWENEGDQTLWRADLRAGAKPTRMVKMESMSILSFAIDIDNVYWSVSKDLPNCEGTAAIWRAPRTAEVATPELFWEADDNCHAPKNIFVDGTNLYWTIYPDGSKIDQMPKGQVGGTPKEFGVLDQLVNLWVDSTDAYWIEQPYIEQFKSGSIKVHSIVDFTNSATMPVANDPDAVQLTGDATNIYWVTDSGMVRTSKKKGNNGTLNLVDGGGPITSLSVDEKHVYYTVPNEGAIRRVPIKGGAMEPVGPKQDDPQHVVVDEKRIYWTSFAGGKVCLMKKP